MGLAGNPGERWAALTGGPLAPLSSVTPNPGYTELTEGNRGDPVLWMQEHLAAAIPTQPTTGIFEAATTANLESSSPPMASPPRARPKRATWLTLLALPPVAVNWTGGGPSGWVADPRRAAGW